jgi:hypothetical protein
MTRISRSRLVRAAGLLALTAAVAVPLTAPQPAYAYWRGGPGWHGGWHGGGWHGGYGWHHGWGWHRGWYPGAVIGGALLGLGVGAAIASGPYYYAPPPVVYAPPPPVVYAPPPVVYAPY